MNGYFGSCVVAAVLLLIGVAIFAGGLPVNRALRPHRPTPEKPLTYECGIDPVGEGWAQTRIRYYVFAYLYVVFAVDAVFLFPWAVVFATPGYGVTTLVEMLVLLGVIALHPARLAEGGAHLDMRPHGRSVPDASVRPETHGRSPARGDPTGGPYPVRPFARRPTRSVPGVTVRPETHAVRTRCERSPGDPRKRRMTSWR